jgi:hypothetical protein
MADLPSVRRWKREATWRGVQAVAMTGASVAMWAAWGWIPGVLGLGAAGYLVYRWFMWRARHGLRF